jgi:hypothetical protein
MLSVDKASHPPQLGPIACEQCGLSAPLVFAEISRDGDRVQEKFTYACHACGWETTRVAAG